MTDANTPPMTEAENKASEAAPLKTLVRAGASGVAALFLMLLVGFAAGWLNWVWAMAVFFIVTILGLLYLCIILARRLQQSDLQLAQAEAAVQLAREQLEVAREHEQEAAHADSLTGLLNRSAFYELAQRETLRAQRYRRQLSVAYIDLDNFKQVNDKSGYDTGDRLLQCVGGLLQKHCRQTDVVGRLGGDEFALLFTESGYESAEAAIGILHKALLEGMQQNGWPVTFSIGLVTFNVAPDTVDQLVRTADELMCAVKMDGKNRVMRAVAGT